ncbi:hypothetical protein GO755_39685 [Spirosoma sp. HMF4905]|uniref:Uncharacterized protein n=1 Tax=Spirosoma arboris TaxID=2682092 RepID=A0A7K1SQZ1_9BACT|nr:hypothetical protein [Spirosoma arboris]MVM36199.1 hypothetical protein [Spirosoma arboris]
MLNKVFAFSSSDRLCYSVPVSSTGSLWDGFGGWLFRVCSGLFIEPARRQSRTIRTACRVIQPGRDFLGSSYPSPCCLSQLVKDAQSCP